MTLSDDEFSELFTDIMKDTVQLVKLLEAEQVDKEAAKTLVKRMNAAAGLGKSIMTYKSLMV